MKTLKQFKRECVGLVLAVEEHDNAPGRVGLTRKIEASNNAGFSFADGFWLDWPRAKHVEIGEGIMTIDLNHDGNFTRVMSYTWDSRPVEKVKAWFDDGVE